MSAELLKQPAVGYLDPANAGAVLNALMGTPGFRQIHSYTAPAAVAPAEPAAPVAQQTAAANPTNTAQ